MASSNSWRGGGRAGSTKCRRPGGDAADRGPAPPRSHGWEGRGKRKKNFGRYASTMLPWRGGWVPSQPAMGTARCTASHHPSPLFPPSPPPPNPPPVYVPSKAASMLLSSHQPAGDPALDPVDDHGRRQQRLPLLLLSCRQWWGRGRPWRRPRRWRPRRGGQRRRQAAGGHVTLDVCFVFTLRSIACGSPTKELFFHRWNQAPPAVRQRGGHSFPVAIDG